jgi:single-strand DNA-binding protein
MADNTVTLVGNVTDDPELRFTPTGRPVANFTVAVNKRFKDNDGQWQDRLDGFFRCNCWADMAENVAESLTKGTRIVVTGRLQQRQWEDNDGNKRSAFEIQVDEVGPSLRWATASVQKSQRSGGQSSGGGGGGQQSGGGQSGGSSDWSAPAPVGSPADEGGF